MKSSLMHTYIKRRLNKLQINRELHFKVCSVYLERSKTMMRWFSLYKNWRQYLIEENTLIIQQSFSFMLLHSTGLYPIFISYFTRVSTTGLYPIFISYFTRVLTTGLYPSFESYFTRVSTKDGLQRRLYGIFSVRFLALFP